MVIDPKLFNDAADLANRLGKETDEGILVQSLISEIVRQYQRADHAEGFLRVRRNAEVDLAKIVDEERRSVRILESDLEYALLRMRTEDA